MRKKQYDNNEKYKFELHIKKEKSKSYYRQKTVDRYHLPARGWSVSNTTEPDIARMEGWQKDNNEDGK